MWSNLELFKGLLRMMDVRGFDTSYYQLTSNETPEHFDNVVIPWMIKNPTSIQKYLIDKGKNTPRYMLSTTFNHLIRPLDRCVVYFIEIGVGKSVPLSETCTFGEVYLRERNDPFLNGSTTGIIISSLKMSNPAFSRMSEFKHVDPHIFLQHFLDIDLLYNPNDSNWGSTATILSLEESKKILIENGLIRGQLPLIDINSPVGKYHGIRPDQIIRFDRHTFIPDTPIQNEIFFRLAIERNSEPNKPKKNTKITKSTAI